MVVRYMDMIIEIYSTVYKHVFCKTFNRSCYVFLCGGSGKCHIRNKIRLILEKKQFQIFYPEDLFIEMFNKDKKADLLEYENLLADNSDIICIICESIGSAVELGAFIQNEKIKNKMVVVINSKFSRDKSFVIMGPVKHLKKISNTSVVFYRNNEIDELGNMMVKVFRKMYKEEGHKNESCDTLSAFIVFIPMIIYFFQTVNRKKLHKNFREYLKLEKILPNKYNELFNASVRYLIKSGIVTAKYDLDQKEETLSLSSKGYQSTYNLLAQSSEPNRTRLHDKIRCDILNKQLSS